jgi:hypothetical protein
MTRQSLLCVFLMAREIPVTVPPVPAPATMTSTFPEDGVDKVEGVDTIASIISGPVVYSCAKGLLTYKYETKNDHTSALRHDRQTFRYWSSIIPCGISRSSFSATPAIVEEFSHETTGNLIVGLYLYGSLESPKQPQWVYGPPRRLVREV